MLSPMKCSADAAPRPPPDLTRSLVLVLVCVSHNQQEDSTGLHQGTVPAALGQAPAGIRPPHGCLPSSSWGLDGTTEPCSTFWMEREGIQSASTFF